MTTKRTKIATANIAPIKSPSLLCIARAFAQAVASMTSIGGDHRQNP